MHLVFPIFRQFCTKMNQALNPQDYQHICSRQNVLTCVDLMALDALRSIANTKIAYRDYYCEFSQNYLELTSTNCLASERL